MCESDTSWLVGFHFEKAATGSAAWMGITIECALGVAMAYSVGAVPAGIALHDLAHGGVGVFLYVEKGVIHLSVLHRFNDFVCLGVSGFALAKVLGDAGPDSVDLGFNEEVILCVGGDAVLLLLSHASLVVFLN